MKWVAALLLALAPPPVSEAEVQRVHRAAILIDTHNDVPMKVVQGYDIAQPSPGGSTDLARLRAGGVDAVFFAAYVPGRYARKPGASAAHARKVIHAIRNDIVRKHPEAFVLATTADDIVAAARQGKIAALIGIEGGHAIEDSLKLLHEFFGLGVRYMTLTHSNTNNWADSSGARGKPRHGGLNDLGRRIVAEMNRLGMMIDVSHVSDDTFRDVMNVSTAPVIASHSSVRAISNARRNMSDDMIRDLAKNGGVIQINFACDFLNEKSRRENPAAKAALWRKYGDDVDSIRAESEKRFTRASLGDVVAHIDHVVKLVGIDHVGIGSDFDGVDCTPVGLEDNSKFPALTRALLEKGYSAGQIQKIYGGNTLRVMRIVEQIARRP